MILQEPCANHNEAEINKAQSMCLRSHQVKQIFAINCGKSTAVTVQRCCTGEGRRDPRHLWEVGGRRAAQRKL